jgi:C_GCAxxG_C_C family probable redox protein
VLLVIEELFDLKADDALKAATAFGGGIGRMGSVCGALLGGAMALGLLYGRSIEEMRKGHQGGKGKTEEKLALLTKKLAEKFEKEYNSQLCNDIEKRLFGRSFDKWNPAERKKKEEMGAYTDKCPSVVGKAARWVAELILDEREGNNSRRAQSQPCRP